MITPIPESDLVVRHLYRVRARNLLGPSVYAGNGKFLGIREKIGQRFTETEYLNAQAYRPFNTCTPFEDLGPIPDEIELIVYLPEVDRESGRPVKFDAPTSCGGRGWYYADTGESDQDIHAVVKQYEPLYLYLEQAAEQNGNPHFTNKEPNEPIL